MILINKKWIWFSLSGILIIASILMLFFWKLNLGLDFKGGSLVEIEFIKTKDIKINEINKILNEFKIESFQVQKSGDNSVFIKAKSISKDQLESIEKQMEERIGDLNEKKYENVGPTVSKDLAQKAYWSLALASIFIILYIAYAFRKVPKPANSFAFGVCAVIALVHDSIILLGFFVFLGKYYGVEIDSLFITAVLTVIGYSVHDTIVIFDRIRENLIKYSENSFDKNIIDSLYQTLDRSITTSFTVIIVLAALLVFGGESIKWFVVALFVGTIIGTYSSIFVASQLLSVWHNKIIKNSNVS
jgi:preprotein translocase subunit SecF